MDLTEAAVRVILPIRDQLRPAEAYRYQRQFPFRP